jgi:hypothetical protein
LICIKLPGQVRANNDLTQIESVDAAASTCLCSGVSPSLISSCRFFQLALMALVMASFCLAGISLIAQEQIESGRRALALGQLHAQANGSQKGLAVMQESVAPAKAGAAGR